MFHPRLYTRKPIKAPRYVKKCIGHVQFVRFGLVVAFAGINPRNHIYKAETVDIFVHAQCQVAVTVSALSHGI